MTIGWYLFPEAQIQTKTQKEGFTVQFNSVRRMDLQKQERIQHSP